MRSTFGKRFSTFLAAWAVLCAGASLSGAVTMPPACDKTLNTCERLSWVEQMMFGRDKGAIPHLRVLAEEDAHERVRERSLGALVMLGDTGAPSVFRDRLSSDLSPAVRRAAAEGIGLLNLPVPPALLTEALRRDSNPLVRAECARALGRTTRAEGAAGLVVALLEDPSPEVRALSAEAIAGLKTPWGTEALKQAAQDKSPIVRLYVIRGLAESAPSDAVPLFREVWETTSDAEARIEAFQGLLRSRDSATWANSGLADRDERIRFLSFREWLARSIPRSLPKGDRDNAWIRRIEPFLSDSSRGIRELAKGYLENQGFRIRPSGFFYVLQE